MLNVKIFVHLSIDPHLSSGSNFKLYSQWQIDFKSKQTFKQNLFHYVTLILSGNEIISDWRLQFLDSKQKQEDITHRLTILDIQRVKEGCANHSKTTDIKKKKKGSGEEASYPWQTRWLIRSSPGNGFQPTEVFDLLCFKIIFSKLSRKIVNEL